MDVKQIILNNLGYELLGGPVLAFVALAVGTVLWETVAGLGIAIAIYVLGWVQIARRWTADPDPERTEDSDGLDTEKKAQAEKTGTSGGF